MVATRSLSECAESEVRSAIDEAPDEDPVILWWDMGGDLRDIVEHVSRSLDCAFHTAEHTPLELRANVPRDRTVWYVALPRPDDAKVDWLNWFKDVEHTGGIIEQNIGKLAVRCFEEDPLEAHLIRTAYENADAAKRQEIAYMLYEQLSGRRMFPKLQSIQTQIVLGGHEEPVQFVLEHEPEDLPDRDDLLGLRGLLVDDGVTVVEGETDPNVIVEKTRRWGVAQWLVDEGLNPNHLPSEYQSVSETTERVPKLRSTLNKADRELKGKLANTYLNPDHQFWHSTLHSIDNPWNLADCPVDSSLEHKLWDKWTDWFQNEAYDTCATHAKQRHERLDTAYGDAPWTSLWEEAIEIAELAEDLRQYEESDNARDVVKRYGDLEDGSWQIDEAVFELTISDEPERDLPPEHPATATLGGIEEIRRSLVEKRYLEYITDLGELVTDRIEAGTPFTGKEHRHVYQFFHEEKAELESGQSIVLFIIDALRFDLAHRLAESIRDRFDSLEVEESTWVGTLPSETEFGKAALTPGSRFDFTIELRDGELVPVRSSQKITYARRKRLLTDKQWSFITQKSDDGTGWNNKRVAYYWNDIDTLGEQGFQELLKDRLENLSEFICEKLRKGGWDRAYILPDHGFVSHPNETEIDREDPPDEAEIVKRRWIAGSDLDGDAPGVLLEDKTNIGYIKDETRISVLADPNKIFSGKGIEKEQFFHGGGLPQEFVLNFITITQE